MKKTFLLCTGLMLFSVTLLYIAGGCKSTPARPSVKDAEGDVAVFPQPGIVGVYTAALSPDKKSIISSQIDGSIRIWDVESGRQIRSINGRQKGSLPIPIPILSVAWSPDGRRFLSCDSFTLKVWDTETCRELWFVPEDYSFEAFIPFCFSAAWSPDGKTIAAGMVDGTIKLYNAANNREMRKISGLRTDEYRDSFINLCFSPNGELIVASSFLGTVKIFNAKTGETIKTLSEQIHRIDDINDENMYMSSLGAVLAFSPDGKRLAFSQIKEKIIRVYDVESGRELYQLAGHDLTVNSVAFSPDGKYIVSGSADRAVIIWDSENGNELRRYPSRHEVQFVSFRDHRILAGTSSSFVEVDGETAKELRSFQGNIFSLATALSPQGDVFFADRIWKDGTSIPAPDVKNGLAAAYSPNGSILAVLIPVEKENQEDENPLMRPVQIKLINTETKEELGKLSEFYIIRIIDPFTIPPLGFSLDGKQIMSGSGDGHVIIWDTRNGEKVWDRPLHKNIVTAMAFGPGGRIASCSADGTLKVWDEQNLIPRTFSNLAEPRTFNLGGNHIPIELVTSLAFSPDGKYIAVSSMDRITLLDIQSGREIWSTGEFEFMFVKTLAYNPGGNHIFAYSIFMGAYILDAATGKALFTIPAAETGYSTWPYAAYSQDGKYLFFTSFDFAHLWDATTYKEIAQFAAFADDEWICVTPDGYYNASPTGDRNLNVRVDNRVTGIDSFRHIFYNPDLVAARLAGREDPVIEKTFNIQDARSFFPSTLSLKTPATTTTATTNLTVTVLDDNQPLQSIKIFVNGRLVGRDELSGLTGARGLVAEKASLTVTGKQKSLNFYIPLVVDPGENIVEVVTFNGHAENRKNITLNRQTGASYKPELPNLWILAVGVNNYDNARTDKLHPENDLYPLGNLNYCANDAREIVNTFKALEGNRYAKVNSFLVASGETIAPTAENILRNLSLLEQAGPRDVILLFLAGHGVNDEKGRFHFLPQDAIIQGNSYSNTISGDAINSVLESPGNRLIFIDACHSGNVDNDRMLRQFMDTNAYVFASCKGNELSYEDPLDRRDWKWNGHGVFTYSILETFKERRNEGIFRVKDLIETVSKDVPRRMYRRQNPVGYSLMFYDFIIGE
jgi:WD40 repeat protein